MSHEKIGPKEQQLRDLKANKIAKKPSTSDLRAKIKPVARHGGKRGR